jgi:hypothetical protein
MRYAATSLLALSLLAAPALAAGKEPEPGTTVEMPILIAPMEVDGRLGGYAYISSMIVATSPNAAIEVRARTPFIQDAFVRDVNGASIVKPGVTDAADANAVDADGLIARLLADARRIAGDKKIAGVKLTQVSLTPLRDPSGS